MTAHSRRVQEIAIGPDVSIRDAIAVLTRTERRILLVCDDAGTLLGTVTDFDIRRSILANAALEGAVHRIMATKPIVLSSDLSELEISAFMRSNRVHYVPIVDANNRAIDIRYAQDAGNVEVADARVAVVMAGGFGRRLRPYTEDVPKPMLTVGGRPMLFMILDQIIAEGFTKIYVSVHYKSDVIVRAINAVRHYRELVTFINEREPLGTAGGLSLLPQRPNRSFLVINADIVNQVPLLEMSRYHECDGNLITIATKLEHYTVPFGVIEVQGARVSGIREKPSVEYIVNIGAYMLEPSVLDGIGKDERLDMPDLIGRVLRSGKPVGRFPVHEYWLDIGTPEQYVRANNEISTLTLSRAG